MKIVKMVVGAKEVYNSRGTAATQPASKYPGKTCGRGYAAPTTLGVETVVGEAVLARSCCA